MRHWNEPRERREAVRLFVKHLHKKENHREREDCKHDKDYAKERFAAIGEVEGIPDETEFCVYEFVEIEPRDSEYAIFLLPDPTKPLAPATERTREVDVTAVYRCTWDPWAGHRED